MQKQTTSFQAMLQDFPQWKKKVKTTQKSEKTKFDTFLDTQWKPLKSKFDEVLEDWQGPEKRQRCDDVYLLRMMNWMKPGRCME